MQKKIDLSDTLFTEETALMIKDDGTNSEHVIPQAIRAFDRKRIAVFTGTVHAEIVKEVLPSAKLFYFEGNANALAALTSGKVDAIVNDDSILLEIKRENPSLTLIDGYLKTFDGIISTMIITVLSIIFGTILGFVIYLSCRNGNLIANLITRFFVWLI